MNPLSLFTSRGLIGLCLLASLGFFIPAVATHNNTFIIAAIVFALLPAFIATTMSARERPEDDEIREFIARSLRARFGGEAADVTSVTAGSPAGLYGKRIFLSFKATIVIKEALHCVVDPPWSKFHGLNNRQLSVVRKQAEVIISQLGDKAAELKEGMPEDPFALYYIAPCTLPGSTLRIEGGLTALPNIAGWSFTLRKLTCRRDPVEQLGRVASHFGNPVVLGTREGDLRIATFVTAWHAYIKLLSDFQDRLQIQSQDTGRRAAEGFFEIIRAGTFFHGTGRSASGQHPPTPFFVEIRSIDSTQKTISFFLRNDGPWEFARLFTGTVAFDETEKIVSIHSTTEVASAFDNGGPLIGAAARFTLDFRFSAEPTSQLESLNGDVLMQLQAIAREAMPSIRDRVFSKRSLVQSAITTGATYTARMELGAGSDRSTTPVTLHFLETTGAARRVEAQLETPRWSRLFAVAITMNPYAPQGSDLVLSALLPSEPGEQAAAHDWNRIALDVVPGGLMARIDAAEKPLTATFTRSKAPGVVRPVPPPSPEHAVTPTVHEIA